MNPEGVVCGSRASSEDEGEGASGGCKELGEVVAEAAQHLQLRLGGDIEVWGAYKTKLGEPGGKTLMQK